MGSISPISGIPTSQTGAKDGEKCGICRKNSCFFITFLPPRAEHFMNVFGDDLVWLSLIVNISSGSKVIIKLIPMYDMMMMNRTTII
jgi:hypothetical protein